MTRLPPTLPIWVAGGLALALAEQPWWHISAGPGALAASLTGTAASGGLAQALALVALAGAAATLVLQRVGRRVVSVLLLATFAGAAVLGMTHPAPGSDTVRSALGAAALSDAWTLSVTAWPWVFGASGLAGVVAAGFLFIQPVAESSRSVRGPAPRVEDSLASWKAMDEGLDPTD